MANVKFDDYLNDELKNNDFKNGYLNEKTILESSLNVASTVLPQRQLTEISHVSKSTIARIECGCNTVVETINKLELGKNYTIS
nr:transcriptional regulator [uncultured Lachnoanaerobaculum sp.]